MFGVTTPSRACHGLSYADNISKPSPGFEDEQGYVCEGS
jgi:hypothetical protein